MLNNKKKAIHIVCPIEGKGMKKICSSEREAKETLLRWNTPKPYPYKEEKVIVYEYKKEWV